MPKFRYPHPEFADLVEAVKRHVVRREEITVAGIAISLAVFRTEENTPDLSFYDEDGVIYIPEDLLRFNEGYAHLIALHERVEVEHKLAGRAHAYAHRRGLLMEFLSAREVFSEARQLENFLNWRIGQYPAWKNLDQPELVAQLVQRLSPDRPRRGDLFKLIKDYAL